MSLLRTLVAVGILGGNSILVTATFPSEPIAIEGANITETNSIGTVAECQAIQVTPTDDINCGSSGVISARGIVPINMWPNQPNHPTAAECAVYCQNRVGNYYRSFGLFSGNNLTIGYSCECYDNGVGALKLTNGTGSGKFYDSGCFVLEC